MDGAGGYSGLLASSPSRSLALKSVTSLTYEPEHRSTKQRNQLRFIGKIADVHRVVLFGLRLLSSSWFTNPSLETVFCLELVGLLYGGCKLF